MASILGNKMWRLFGIFLVFFVFGAGVSTAGQVLTKDVKAWARQVVGQERKLGEMSGRERTIGVLPFVQVSGDPEFLPLQKGLAVMIAVDLSKVKGLTVLDRVKTQALIQELALTGSGLLQAQSGPRIGKLLQAEWMVGGEYGIGRDIMGLDSRLLDVKTTGILDHVQGREDVKKIFDLEKRIVKDLIKTLKIKLTPEEEKALEVPLTTSFDALMAFSRGLDASDRGDYAAAFREYKKAAADDPGFTMAKDAADELVSLGLLAGLHDFGPDFGFLQQIRDDSLSLIDTLGSEIATMRLTKPTDSKERGTSQTSDRTSDDSYYTYP